MARPVENAGGNVARPDALCGGERGDVLGDRLCKVDDALGVARTDGDLVHVHVGRVEQAAFLGDRQHGKRVRPGLGGDRRPLEGIERDVDLGTDSALTAAAADLFADEQHRGLVALALADDDRAVEVEFVQRIAHRLDRGGVGGVLVAAADLRAAGDRRLLGHPDHFEDEDAVEDLAALHGNSVEGSRRLAG